MRLYAPGKAGIWDDESKTMLQVVDGVVEANPATARRLMADGYKAVPEEPEPEPEDVATTRPEPEPEPEAIIPLDKVDPPTVEKPKAPRKPAARKGRAKIE